MGQGPLPPPKPSQYNYSTRTGVLPAATPAKAGRFATMQAAVNAQLPQVQQATQTMTRSQRLLDAAAASKKPSSTRQQGQRYWQGSGTEVVGGMSADYNRMQIAGPRTMGAPSFMKSWQGEALTNRIQAGMAAAIDTQEAAQRNAGRGSIVPYSGRVASMPTGQGPLPPPRTPGVGLSPLYQPQAQQRTPSAPNAGPLYRPTGDTPVSQGSRVMTPSSAGADRAGITGRNQMFGSGVLWGEETGGTTGENAWNANMPGSMIAADKANAQIARERKAGAKQSALYRASLEWPDQK